MSLDDLLRYLTPLSLVAAAAAFVAAHFKLSGRRYVDELSKKNAELNAENRAALEARIAILEGERNECLARLEAQDKKLASQDEAMAILREQVTQVAAVDKLASAVDAYYRAVRDQLDRIEAAR